MFLNIIIDFLLYTLSFFLFHYIRKNEFLLDKKYLFYYLSFMISWIAASLLSRKFMKRENKLLNRLYPYFIAFFLMLGLLTMLIIRFNMLSVSRFVLLGSLIFAFVIELIITTVKNRSIVNYPQIKIIISGKAFLFEFIVYAFIILYITLYKLDYHGFEDKYALILAGMYLSWFTAALFGHRFDPGIKRKNYWKFIWPYIIGYTIIISLNSFFCIKDIKI